MDMVDPVLRLNLAAIWARQKVKVFNFPEDMVKFSLSYVLVINVIFGANAFANDARPHFGEETEGLPQLPSNFKFPGRVPGALDPGLITIDPPAIQCTPVGLDPFGEIVEGTGECNDGVPNLIIPCGGGDCVPPQKKRFFYFPKAQ
jgi:hypothetical protein